MLSKSRLIVVVSMMLLIALALISITTTAQFGATPSQYYTTQVIMNLENGQQNFGMPHVYQGDNGGSPTNSYPVYYGPSTASQYWSQGGISSDQPVFMMVPAQTFSASAMFWNETYIGGPVKITIIGTFSTGSSPVADGFEIYLFLTPTTWSVSPNYNYSISYISTPAWRGTGYPSPIEGDVILPQSSTPYIEVQWNPIWSNGQWNIWIVNNTNGNNPSVTPSPSPNGVGSAGWNDIGTGTFQPNPGDRINVTVTYDPSANTLTGVATDLNTGQSANFTLNLTNYYTPPSSGNYVFGVGADTGGAYANWALLYVAVTQQVLTSASANVVITEPTGFSAVPIWAVVVDAVAIVIIAISTTILIMSRRSRR